MKLYIDDLLKDEHNQNMLPLCVQRMRKVKKAASTQNPLKLVFGEFYNGAIQVEPFFKAITTIANINHDSL